MTEPPSISDIHKAMRQISRFAEVWAAEITEAFKPFNEAVERMQQRERERRRLS